MRVRPLTPDAVVTELADRIAECRGPGPATRVLVDGAPPAEPGGWAQALVDPLRLRGRPVVRARAEDFLRPASLRLEQGRRDPDAFYAERLDTGALVRELLAPAGPGGSGRVLPRFWDAAADRAARAGHVDAGPGGVVLLHGTLLLGLGLPAELVVHLHLSEHALRRGTPPEHVWTLPAYRRYAEEVGPEEVADVVLRVDHPDRPALSST
ncbi:MAG: uridine kinase [Pseudonocardiaceae bacterium]|nr:uridine kinase [Pseudonocardiaceae bacterium]